MKSYKIPDWLTPGGNIKANAEKTSSSLEMIRADVWKLNQNNLQELAQRESARQQALKDALEAYGENDRITRAIYRTKPARPPDLIRLCAKFCDMVEAHRAQLERNRRVRVFRRIKNITDQDWPAEPLINKAR